MPIITPGTKEHAEDLKKKIAHERLWEQEEYRAFIQMLKTAKRSQLLLEEAHMSSWKINAELFRADKYHHGLNGGIMEAIKELSRSWTRHRNKQRILTKEYLDVISPSVQPLPDIKELAARIRNDAIRVYTSLIKPGYNSALPYFRFGEIPNYNALHIQEWGKENEREIDVINNIASLGTIYIDVSLPYTLPKFGYLRNNQGHVFVPTHAKEITKKSPPTKFLPNATPDTKIWSCHAYRHKKRKGTINGCSLYIIHNEFGTGCGVSFRKAEADWKKTIEPKIAEKLYGSMYKDATAEVDE
jgi:hypothetical protein